MDPHEVCMELQRCMKAVDEARTAGQLKQAEYALGDAMEVLFDRETLPLVFDEGALRLLHRELCSNSDLVSTEEGARVSEQLKKARSVHDFLFSIVDRKQTALDSAMLALIASEVSVDDVQGLDEEQLLELQKIRSQGAGGLQSCAESFAERLAEFLPAHKQQLTALTSNVVIAAKTPKTDKGTVYGLFVCEEKGYVRPLRVLSIDKATNLQVTQLQRASSDEVGTQWDQKACHAALRLAFGDTSFTVTWDLAREDTGMQGSSNGLALSAAILEKSDSLPKLDPYTASTGEVDADGAIHPVQGLEQKLQGAVDYGIRRVFVPQGCKLPEATPSLKVMPVASLQNLCDELNADWASVSTGVRSEFDRRKLLLNAFLREQGYQLQEREHNEGLQYQIKAYQADGTEIVVSGYPTTGKWRVESAPISLKSHLEELVGVRHKTRPSVPQESRVAVYAAPVSRSVIDEHLQKRVRSALDVFGTWQSKPVEHSLYAMELSTSAGKAVVTQYKSGKLVIGGQGDVFQKVCETVDRILEHDPAKDGGGPTSAPNRGRTESHRVPPPYVGTDESGKGDYLGPLVIAGVLVDRSTIRKLEDIGVRDSKRLSDNQVLGLAPKIESICGRGRCSTVTIMPETYNSLYEEFRKEGKNLNVLLAWGHARALENLIGSNGSITAVADQFGDPHYIESKLLEKARGAKLNLIQRPKAESEIGVAAASILARAEYLRRMDALSRAYGIELPKGASSEVAAVAKQIVVKHGQPELRKVAKLHFKTTKDVLMG